MDEVGEGSKVVANGEVKDGKERKYAQMMPFYEYVFMEYSIMAEMLLFQQQSLTGIYILPSSMSSLIWNGVMFIRQGSYQGGHFRFKLLIPDGFPNDGAISIIFTPAVFHPLIHPVNGELETSRAFQPWKKKVHHLWNVIAYAKRCFLNIDVTNPLNEEAAALFQDDPELFKVRVKESIEKCTSQVNLCTDPDDSQTFRFTELDEKSRSDAKKQIMDIKDSNILCASKGETDIRNLGLSWMSERLRK